MQGLRYKFSLFIYEKKDLIFKVLSWIMWLTALVTLASLVYYHGFSHTPEELDLLITINKSFFAIFIVNYLVRMFFSLDWRQYLRSTWVEASLLGLVIFNFFTILIFRFPFIARMFEALDFEGFEPYYVFFIQCYLLVLVFLEIVKSVQQFGTLKLRPTTIFMLSFLLLIAIGTGLLSLPGVTQGGVSLRFIDALFTSVSASCVTGLIVVDTPTFFNIKGQFILLFLFQLGGIGIISFATFFATFMKKGLGLKHQSMMQELFDNESLLGTVSLLRKIIIYTVTIEFLSFLLIYSFWGDHYFSTTGKKIFFSVFHAVSAFCNAGFVLFTDGLYSTELRYNYLLHMAIGITVFFGSLGFPAIRDIFDLHNIRERISKPWKRWKLSTQIAVYASVVLVVFGAIMFYFLEQQGTLAELQLMPALITGIFQSITARSSGFNTVDFSLIGTPMLMIFIFLMFVGASSGSTGGGIKTSTFVVAFSAILATVTGKRSVTLGRRTISKELIFKAFAIFIFSAMYIFISVVILTICEPKIAITNLIFEEVSAFATVGLSTGITAQLSDISKVVIILSMFVGRVGVLSLAFTLSVPVKYGTYRYPNSHIMIG